MLGHCHGHRQKGAKRRRVQRNDEVIDIPLLESLEQWLNNPSILQQVEKIATSNLSSLCESNTNILLWISGEKSTWTGWWADCRLLWCPSLPIASSVFRRSHCSSNNSLLEIRYLQSPSYWGAFCVYNLTSCTLFPYAYNEYPHLYKNNWKKLKHQIIHMR